MPLWLINCSVLKKILENVNNGLRPTVTRSILFSEFSLILERFDVVPAVPIEVDARTAYGDAVYPTTTVCMVILTFHLSIGRRLAGVFLPCFAAEIRPCSNRTTVVVETIVPVIVVVVFDSETGRIVVAMGFVEEDVVLCILRVRYSGVVGRRPVDADNVVRSFAAMARGSASLIPRPITVDPNLVGIVTVVRYLQSDVQLVIEVPLGRHTVRFALFFDEERLFLDRPCDSMSFEILDKSPVALLLALL